MATTRDQAYQQYQNIYNEFGRGDLLTDGTGDTDRQFEDYWKNASADSGMLQGSQYQQSWESLMPYIRDQIYNRVNDGADSQGSDPGLQAPTQTQASPTASPAVPSDSPRDTALQQVSQTYTSATAPSAFTSGLRDVLMSQLGAAQQPVSASDSQFAPIANAIRLENQRAAERQRSQLAAQMNHPDMNLGSSGAFDAGLQGIMQAQGEANATGIARLLQGEMGRRSDMLRSLLGMGLSSGEAEAGRNLQGYLGDQANQRYYAGLGQDQSQFQDRMGYDWTALQQQGNLQALMMLLNAI